MVRDEHWLIPQALLYVLLSRSVPGRMISEARIVRVQLRRLFPLLVPIHRPRYILFLAKCQYQCAQILFQSPWSNPYQSHNQDKSLHAEYQNAHARGHSCISADLYSEKHCRYRNCGNKQPRHILRYLNDFLSHGFARYRQPNNLAP